MFFTRAQASIWFSRSIDTYEGVVKSYLNLDKFKCLMSRKIDDTLRNCIISSFVILITRCYEVLLCLLNIFNT